MKYDRKMLKITWREKRTNEFVWRKATEVSGERPESVEEITKRRTLKYYGHQTRKQALSKVIVERRVEGSRERGRARRQWEDDLKKWSGWTMEELRRAEEDMEGWQWLVHNWVSPWPDG